jgi:hypothetical protein
MDYEQKAKEEWKMEGGGGEIKEQGRCKRKLRGKRE